MDIIYSSLYSCLTLVDDLLTTQVLANQISGDNFSTYIKLLKLLFKSPYVLASFLSYGYYVDVFKILGYYGTYVPDATNQVYSAIALSFTMGQSLPYVQNHLDEKTFYISCNEDKNVLIRMGIERGVNVTVLNMSDLVEKEEVSNDKEKTVVIIPNKFIDNIASKATLRQFLSVGAKSQLVHFIHFSCRENDLAVKRVLNSIMTMIVCDVSSVNSNVEFMFMVIEFLTMSDHVGRIVYIEYCLKGPEAIWNLCMQSTVVLMEVRVLKGDLN